MRNAILLACAVFGLAPAVAAAQEPGDYFGKPVAEVRIAIEDDTEVSPALRQLITVPVGEPLRPQDVRSTMAALARLNTFEEQIDVLAEDTAAGVLVTFRVSPRHPVDRIDITGETGLPAAELQRLVVEQFGRVLPLGLTHERVSATVERVLRDEGYLRATVSQIEPVLSHEEHRATLRVTVEAGPRAIISDTNVVGESPFTPAEVIARVGAQPGQPFRESAIRDALASMRDDLGDRGYYAARARLTDRVPSPDGRTIELTLLVTAGPIVQVTWDRSADPPPSGGLDTYVPVKREGSVDDDLLDQGEVNLEAALRREGYFTADVSHTRQDAGAVLTITYRIVRGRRYYVDRVEIPGSLQLPRAQIEKLLDVQPGDVLDERQVTQGAARVIELYHQQGYYLAGFNPKYQELPERQTPTEAWVVLLPQFIEGPRGIVEEIQFTFQGDDGTHASEAELLAVMQSKTGAPYLDVRRIIDEDALRDFYDARGYRDARVEILGADEQSGERIVLRVLIQEGSPSVIGDVVVFGNRNISTASILEDLTLREGQPLSERALAENERLLLERGVFRRVRIQPEPALPGETRVRVVVNIEESPSNTIGYGAGFEVGTITRTAADGRQEAHLETSPRGFFQFTRRNVGGRNRQISIFSRLSLKPAKEAGGRRFGFAEYRVAATLREFRAFRTDTDLLAGIFSEQAVRTGFNFIRRGFSAEALRRLSTSVAVTGRYGLDFTRLFDIQPIIDQQQIDRLFPQVRLSTFSAGALRDRRDNPIAPTRGSLITADVETAVRAIGSEVGYIKAFVQASRFLAPSEDGRFVFAGRLQFGLARGFERQVERLDENGNPVLDADGNPIVDIVADLPASQRFFAGGSTTVRGFQLDRLGVPEIIDPATGLSRGGNGLVVLNAEVRTAVFRIGGRPLAVVGFFDAGNVFEKVGDLDFGRLRGTPGFGVRYDSPLGAFRVDVGFKLTRLEIGGRRERGFEVHLSIGEAF